MMKLTIDGVLLSIFEDILSEGKSDSEWAEIESDDMFQKKPFVGGYDADEKAFCFSFYSSDGEYFFKLTLNEIRNITNGQVVEIDMEKADV